MAWVTGIVWLMVSMALMWWQTTLLYKTNPASADAEKEFEGTADGSVCEPTGKEENLAAECKKVKLIQPIGLPVIDICAIAFVALMGGVCGYLTNYSTASVLDLMKMAVAYFCIAAVALADLHEYKISNWFPLSMVIARVIIFIPELFLRRDDLLKISLYSVIGAAVCFLILYVMSVATHGGFGLGDVKLLAALAFLSGTYAVCSTMLYSLILCVLVSIFLLVSKKKGMKDTIPFGPFIMIGYMCTLILATF